MMLYPNGPDHPPIFIDDGALKGAGCRDFLIALVMIIVGGAIGVEGLCMFGLVRNESAVIEPEDAR